MGLQKLVIIEETQERIWQDNKKYAKTPSPGFLRSFFFFFLDQRKGERKMNSGSRCNRG